MEFTADIIIMPLEGLLDTQGRATVAGLENAKLEGFSNVHIGKHITVTVKASSEKEAEQRVDEACKNLLVNQIMEKYSFKLREAATA